MTSRHHTCRRLPGVDCRRRSTSTALESSTHHRDPLWKRRITESGVVKNEKRCYETFNTQTVCFTPRRRGRSCVDRLRVKNCKLFTPVFFCVFMYFDFYVCTLLLKKKRTSSQHNFGEIAIL
jgi:hypothetical protein